MRYIKQRSTSDCGVACLCMIAWHYGKKLPYTEVYEAIGTDKSGSSLFGVCEAAKKYQLEPTALQGAASELKEEVKSGGIKLPIMARIVNHNQQAHFIIVTAMKGNKVSIIDPDESIGKKKISFELFEGVFLGNVIAFEKANDFNKEHRHKNPLFSFFIYAKKQSVAILATIIASVLVTGVALLSSLMMQYLVDDVLHAQSVEMMDEGLELFALIITGMALLYIVRFVVQVIRGWLSTKLVARINQQMMNDVYQKIVDLPLKYFSSKETGELMSRFSDASKINQAISSVVLSIGLDLIMFVGAGVLMYHLSPILFQCTLLIAAVYVIISICYNKPLERANRKAVIESAAINSHLKESVDGICTIKCCNAGEAAKTKFIGMFDRFQKSAVKASMKNVCKGGLIEISGSIGILVLLWIAAMNVVNGEMTTGTVITVYSMLSYFISPIQGAIELQSSIQEAYIAAERLEDIYDSTAETETDGLNTAVENGAIRFDEVSFHYPNSELILDQFSLQIEDGSAVALVGNSGCGKSTAARLITRLYNPVSGKVSIGNHDIQEISLHELRNQVLYVPQDITLFSDTIRNNLLLGIEWEVTDDEIYQTLELCDCSFLKEKGMMLDSVVEEGGTNFSGGQLKRLALARALLRKPKVIILDEVTANLNADCVERITGRINKLPMTKIWITHNPNQIMNLDQIVNMNQHKTLAQHKEVSDLKAAAAT